MSEHPVKSIADFERELTALINKHSIETVSNTPDFILASYLVGCLIQWENHIIQREKSGGRRDERPEYLAGL